MILGSKNNPRTRKYKICVPENRAESTGRNSKRRHMLQVMAKNHFGVNLPIWPSPAQASPAQARPVSLAAGPISARQGFAWPPPIVGGRAGICRGFEAVRGGRESAQTWPCRQRILYLGWRPGKSEPGRDLPGLRCFAEVGPIPARHKSARLPIPERWPDQGVQVVSKGNIEGQSRNNFQLFPFSVSLQNNSPSATMSDESADPLGSSGV